MSGSSTMDSISSTDILESRYRRLLALLPCAYRAQRAEEILGMLLDGAADGRRWPRPVEAASIAGLSLRLRTGAPGGSERSVAFSQVLRQLALAGLLIQVLYYASNFCESAVSLAQWTGAGVTLPVEFDVAAIGVVAALSAAALVCLVRGRGRTGAVLAAFSTLLAWVELARNLASPVQLPFVFPVGLVLPLAAPLAVALLSTAAVVLGFHRDAPEARAPGRWLRTLVFSLLVVLACSVLAQYLNDRGSVLSSMAAGGFDAAAHLVIAPIAPAVAVLFGIVRAPRPVLWSTVLLLSIPCTAVAIELASLLIGHTPVAQMSYGGALLGENGPELAWEAIATLAILAAGNWSAVRGRARPGPAAALRP